MGVAGTLGGPGTQTVFPTGRLNDDWRNGFRVRAGLWLDPGQRLGLEGDFFFLGGSRQGFAAGSPGVDLPVRQRGHGGPDVYPVSFPGVVGGTVSAGSQSDLIGGGVNLVQLPREPVRPDRLAARSPPGTCGTN